MQSLKVIEKPASGFDKRIQGAAGKKIDDSGIDPSDSDLDHGVFEGFTPLTREQAGRIRKASPPVSPVAVLAGQLMAGALVAVIAWAITGLQSAAWSALYGSLSVVLPAALFARGLSRQKAGANAGALLAGFLVWEMVKIGLTVAMLAAAPRLVGQLSWLAMLAGFVVTMKVYWVAIWLRLVRTHRQK